MGSIPQLSILRGESIKPEEWFPLDKIFESAASRASPGDAAVIFNGKSVSFPALNADANRLARGIIAKATEMTEEVPLVAVCMHPSDRLVTVLLACWKAGCAYVPIDPTFPPARVAHILGDSRPFLVIKDRGVDLDTTTDEGKATILTADFGALTAECRTMPDSNPGDREKLRGSEDTQMERTAIVLYTSGSTGAPKGVKIPHRAVLNRLHWQWRMFPFAEDERVATCFKTALTFVDSVSEIFSPLLRGRGLVVASKAISRNPEDLLRLLAEWGVRRLVLVPSLLRAILLCVKPRANQGVAEDPIATHARGIKLWVCSGEVLPLELLKEFFGRFPHGSTICNFYGSTEVMGDVTYQSFSSMKEAEECENTVPIGRPLDNTLVYLLDKQFRPVPSGEVGELFASGLNVASGYIKSKESDRFCHNPFATDPEYTLLYRTGDFACVTKGGVLSYEGRSDSQVKVRGHRVDLIEVERAFTSGVPGLAKAIVLCYKPGHINQAIVAFVTLEDGITITVSEIEGMIQKILPPYMMPEVKVIDKIPLLVNGKTDRQALLKIYEEDSLGGEDDDIGDMKPDLSEVPESKKHAAEVLFLTVEHVLKGSGTAASTLPVGTENCKLRRRGSPLSLKSNFYEIGGNSLNSVYTVMRLRDQGYIIGIGEFIAAKNLGEVLKMMHSEEEITSTDSITRLTEKEKVNEPITNGKGYSLYVPERLSDIHKDHVYKMITSSFYQKADLEQWLMPGISQEDYHDLLDKLWEPLLKANYSFIVRSLPEGTTVGVALNFDAHDEPEIEISSKLNIVFEFLAKLEEPIRSSVLPQGKGHVLYSFMMGTDESLPYQKNVEVIQFMEDEVIRIAKIQNFDGVFTTNTSPLTQQLCTDVNHYKVLLDYQVNLYVAADGSKPFGKAPSSQRATISWKSLKAN
ncbi:beta-alanyl-bioamine nonribosomal peptide synthetase ebony isoform X2 [Hetaerina americana]